MLGVTVRTVQLMVDRGDLQAWKTPGGHRRISRSSVDAWKTGESPRAQAQQRARDAQKTLRRHRPPLEPSSAATHQSPATVVLIEAATDIQQQVRTLVAQVQPQVNLHMAADAITGLTLCSALQPDILMVDTRLPGVDGLSLIRGLQFQSRQKTMHVVALSGSDGPTPPPDACASMPEVRWVHLSSMEKEIPALVSDLLTCVSAECSVSGV